MQNTKLLFIILEFEKDLKAYIKDKNILNLDNNLKPKLKRYQEKANARRFHRNNENKSDIDLLTINECGEILTLQANLITPEFKKNLGDYKRIFEDITQVRNTLVHPYSVNNDFNDVDISYSTSSKIFDGIEKFITLDKFPWKRVKDAFEKINSPEFNLLVYQEVIKDLVFPIIHNLPDSQHKSTQFIGRSDELKKLIKLLKNNRFPLISICGPGGSGKTALILEACNNLLDAQDDLFNNIIFYTMKTEDLLEKIDENRDGKLDSLINTVEKDFDVTLSVEKDLINYIDKKETLLILDNTDNLNSDEIINFYEKFENCKIVITSRIGIGQIEKRIELKKYELESAMFLYTKLIELNDLENTNEDITYEEQKLIIKKLETPLGIKFLIEQLKQGISNEEILNNLDELYEFCSKGIFVNLDENTKTVLACLVKANSNVSIADLAVATNFNIDAINEALMQLERRGLLFKKIIKQENFYEINDISKTYYEKNKDEFKNISIKLGDVEKKILDIKEKVLISNKTRSFNSRYIWFDSENKSEVLISDLLIQALDERSMNNNAKEFIQNAKQIDRSYSEIYRIEAFLLTKTGNLVDAKESYIKSIKLAKKDEHIGASAYWYAGYLFRDLNDATRALEFSKVASDIFPTEYILPQRQHASILNALGDYDEALKVIENLNIDYKDRSITTTLPVRQAITLILEINRRKYIETISQREKQGDFAFEKIINFLEDKLQVILSITNDKRMPDEINRFFDECDRLVIAKLSPEVSSKLISSYINLRKTIPIYFQKNKEREMTIEFFNYLISNLEEMSYVKNVSERIEIFEDFIEYLSGIKTNSENTEAREYYTTGYISPYLRSDNTFVCRVFNKDIRALPISIRGSSNLLDNKSFSFGDKINCIVSINEDQTNEIIDIDKVESNNKIDKYNEDRIVFISLDLAKNLCYIQDYKTGLSLGRHQIEYISNYLDDFTDYFDGAKSTFFYGSFEITPYRCHFIDKSIKPITSKVMYRHIKNWVSEYLFLNTIDDFNKKLKDVNNAYNDIEVGRDYVAKCKINKTLDYKGLTLIATKSDVSTMYEKKLYDITVIEKSNDGKIFCFVKRKSSSNKIDKLG